MQSMTNSTDKSQKKKTPKKKGPIRFEAVTPIAVIIGLMIAYFVLFFDSHLRRALEYGMTLANGAEVNIGNLTTSFKGGSLDIRKIEVTDSQEPIKNFVEIGQIYFELSWDALLRAKFVIDEASLNGLQIHTPRKRPGRVIPEEPEDPSKGPSLADQAAKKMFKMAEDQFQSNALGDLAAMLQGQDPTAVLKNIEGELKASLRAKELEQEFKKKEKEWKERLASLPNAKEFEALGQRVGKVQLGGWKSPQDFQNSLKEIQTIIGEADQKIKNIQSTAGSLQGDVGQFEKSIKELDQLAKQDFEDLQKRIKLPSLDVKDLAKNLFGKMIHEKTSNYQKYIEMGRKYMPTKKAEGEKPPPLTPHERANGKNYRFGRPNSYPLFWLKRAQLTSKAENSPFGGEIDGVLKDATSDPVSLGRPTQITFKGDFPGQGIRQVNSQIILDHTKEEARDWFKVGVGSFPISGRSLVESPDVKFGFAKAAGATEVTGELKGGIVNLMSDTKFGQINYLVESPNRDVVDILKGVAQDIPLVTLTAGVQGPFTDLRWDIRSNLAGALQKAFEKQIQAKIEEAKKKLEAFVKGEIEKYRGQLQAEFDKVKGEIEREIAKVKGEAEKAKQMAEGRVQQARDTVGQEEKRKVEAKLAEERKKAEAQTAEERRKAEAKAAEERKKAEKKAQDEGQKALDELKKKIKF